MNVPEFDAIKAAKKGDFVYADGGVFVKENKNVLRHLEPHELLLYLDGCTNINGAKPLFETDEGRSAP